MNRQSSLGAKVGVGLVAGIMLLPACGDSTDDFANGVELAPTPATSSTSALTTSPPTSSQRAADAVEIGADFLAARDRHDFEATLALMDPAASIIDFGFWSRTPDEYEGVYAWMDILDWRWTLNECRLQAVGPPEHVICTYTTDNEWTRAQEVDPVDGQVDLLIEGDLITGVINEIGPDWGAVFRSWFVWLERNHREDIQVVFRFDDEGNFTGGPATDAEALGLYKTYVPDYVKDIRGS